MAGRINPAPILDSGLYQLIIRLRRHATVIPGRLGVFRLPPGLYIYTGSGRRNLRARMARHLRKRKRLRWHVDYLLQYGIIERGIVYPPGLFTECELNRFTLEVLKGRIPIPGFGASDCHCSSHLICCPPALKASGIQKILCAERGLRAKPLEWEKAAEMMHMEPID